MDFGNNWLYPNTSIETVLKARPRAVELFGRFGLNPWKALHGRVVELCAGGRVSWQDFHEGILALPVPDEESEWKRLPISHLLDFLAFQHREFLQGYLPSIGHALSSLAPADGDGLHHPLRGLAAGWPSFAASLATHIREEDEALFLRLLRYDACKRLGTAGPEFEGGSVRVFTVVRMQEHEHRDMALFRRFFSSALPGFPGRESDDSEERLRPLLKGLERDLGRHARLETEVLFPWGIDLEKELYDLYIRGRVGVDAASLSASTRG